MSTGSLRVAGLAGVLAAATMICSFLVLPVDGGGDAPADIAERYAGGTEGFLRAAMLQLTSLGLTVLLVAGLTLWAARRNALGGLAVAAGGVVLVSAQLAGYAVIATLSLGTAENAGLDVVVALYDLSALFFLVANVGLTLLAAGTAVAALGRRVTVEPSASELPMRRPSHRVLAAWSLLTAVAAVAGALALRQTGMASPHGDVGFVVLVLQVAWTGAAGLTLLRDEAVSLGDVAVAAGQKPSR